MLGWPVPSLLAALLFLAICTPAAVYAQSTGTPAKEMKVILDTDIGDDIDDAYALALLVSLPKVKLLGVTTAFGQTQERAELAAKLLAVMGRKSVPVYAGRRGTAKIGKQYEWAKGFTSKSLKTGEAVDFLKREIERAPGEITLIAIGALTNLGDLFTRYPYVKPKVKQIVIMGGAVHVGYNNKAPATPEWNIKCDPDAARVVYDSGVPLVMAGLEVTTMMQLDEARRKTIYAYNTPMSTALSELTPLWGNGTPTLFDPVAVAWACGYYFSDSEPQKRIVVEDSGLTRLNNEEKGQVTVLINPKKEAFLDWYVAALKGHK